MLCTPIMYSGGPAEDSYGMEFTNIDMWAVNGGAVATVPSDISIGKGTPWGAAAYTIGTPRSTTGGGLSTDFSYAFSFWINPRWPTLDPSRNEFFAGMCCNTTWRDPEGHFWGLCIRKESTTQVSICWVLRTPNTLLVYKTGVVSLNSWNHIYMVFHPNNMTTSAGTPKIEYWLNGIYGVSTIIQRLSDQPAEAYRVAPPDFGPGSSQTAPIVSTVMPQFCIGGMHFQTQPGTANSRPEFMAPQGQFNVNTSGHDWSSQLGYSGKVSLASFMFLDCKTPIPIGSLGGMVAGKWTQHKYIDLAALGAGGKSFWLKFRDRSSMKAMMKDSLGNFDHNNGYANYPGWGWNTPNVQWFTPSFKGVHETTPAIC